MPLKAADLPRRLSSGLEPIYFIAGEESLLVEEAADAVVAAARAQGYSDREVVFTQARDKWTMLEAQAAGMSLFGDRKLIDVRCEPGHIGKDGSAALREYCDKPREDVILLVRCGGLDARQRKAAWVTAVEKAGAFVFIWPVSLADFPGWLRARAADYGLELDSEAFAWLTERAEGNLLMADQALRRVELLAGSSRIDVSAARGAVEDAARYDVFQLMDAVFQRDVQRIPKMLTVLKEEGGHVIPIASTFGGQLRNISNIGRLPKMRQRMLRDFVDRVGTDGVDRLLAELALLDQQAKGDLAGDAWDSLERILLGSAGVRTTPGLGQNRADLAPKHQQTERH